MNCSLLIDVGSEYINVVFSTHVFEEVMGIKPTITTASQQLPLPTVKK